MFGIVYCKFVHISAPSFAFSSSHQLKCTAVIFWDICTELHLLTEETPQKALSQHVQTELAALCSTASLTNLVTGARNLNMWKSQCLFRSVKAGLAMDPFLWSINTLMKNILQRHCYIYNTLSTNSLIFMCIYKNMVALLSIKQFKDLSPFCEEEGRRREEKEREEIWAFFHLKMRGEASVRVWGNSSNLSPGFESNWNKRGCHQNLFWHRRRYSTAHLPLACTLLKCPAGEKR